METESVNNEFPTLTQNCPPSATSGDFFGILPCCYRSLPSSHLQISSTSKPASTETNSVNNTSNVNTSFR